MEDLGFHPTTVHVIQCFSNKLLGQNKINVINLSLHYNLIYILFLIYLCNVIFMSDNLSNNFLESNNSWGERIPTEILFKIFKYVLECDESISSLKSLVVSDFRISYFVLHYILVLVGTHDLALLLLLLQIT